MNKFKKYFLLFLLFSTFTNCFKDNATQNNKLPYVFVQLDINLGFHLGELGFIGGSEIFDHNGRKILVYRTDVSSFRAFDLACPHLYPSECGVPMRFDDSTLPFIICDCGEEEVRYSLVNIPVEYQGEYYQMKEYFAVLSGNVENGGVLRITN